MNIISNWGDPSILFEFSPYNRLMFREVLSKGTEMIDLRVWSKWNTDQQFHPSRSHNGLMLERTALVKILPKLQDLMNGSNKP